MKPISFSEDIIPVGEFKAHAAQWLKKLSTSDTPMLITQNGKPAAVMIPPKAFDEILENQRFTEAVLAGLADVEKGRVYSTKELKKLLGQE